ncbi:MAG TPA: TolC family protein [Candidatus Saccharimonadaceae bacterium]|nr:TolC family protein [Candidatus Saccharimonadaceae bacterium]
MRMGLWIVGVLGLAAGAATARADVLTADRAVELALKHSANVINADANVLGARGNLYSAYSGVLPRVSAGYTRSGSLTEGASGNQVFGSLVIPQTPSDRESYSTSPTLSGSWSILDLSAITGLSSARSGLRAAQLRRTASRQDVALAARRQFYEVVKAVRLADVSSRALQLSRSEERRVRALFEVGSVSKSDLLKAQVQTAQSQLDSLTAIDNVTVQRITLGTVIGVADRDFGDIDTTLSPNALVYDPAQVLDEASKNRPDLKAAELELKSANAALASANLARFPSLSVNGSATYSPFSDTKVTEKDSTGATVSFAAHNESDRQYGASIALNWDLFSGMAIESRIASAQAGVQRAKEVRDAAKRNLEGEVHQALLGQQEAIERTRLVESALASSTENLKLTQEKYNVGSATILDLIDAQVQLQRAESDEVSALAALRVAEAVLDRVRGR